MTSALTACSTPTQALANWCHELNAASLPQDTAREASRHLIDTLAACSAGMKQPLTHAAIAFERKMNPLSGDVPVFGGPELWTLEQAATLMATACHALEMDDGNREGSIHPGTVIIPAALATGWHTNASYMALLTAITAGYEVAVSVAEVLHPHASKRGFQTTPTAGVMGAAAATARLLEMNSSQIESAIGVSASASSGIFAYLAGGGNVKKFHPAHAAREGLRAAFMVQQGLAQGPMGVIETASGILQAIGGITGWDGSRAPKRLQTAIERSYLKPYPCCRHIHPAIDAALELRKKHGWGPDDIARIEVETYTAAMPHAALPWNTLEISQLSFPWVMALACLEGEVTLEGFSEASRQRADLNALAGKVTVYRTDACDAKYPRLGPSGVRITLNSGECLSAFVDEPSGAADKPLSDEALEVKAMEGLTRSFSRDESIAILQRLRRLENWPVRELLTTR